MVLKDDRKNDTYITIKTRINILKLLFYVNRIRYGRRIMQVKIIQLNYNRIIDQKNKIWIIQFVESHKQ